MLVKAPMLNADGIQDSSLLADDFGISSLDRLGLEKKFRIEVQDSDLEGVKSVVNLVGIVERRLAEGT